MKKHYYENELTKADLYALNRRKKCWLLKISTVPQYWIKLTAIFENKSLSSQQKNGHKQLYRPRNGVNERRSEVKTRKSAKTFAN